MEHVWLHSPVPDFCSRIKAAQIVFRCGAPLTMVGLDVTRKVSIPEEVLRKLSSASNPVGRAAERILRAQIEHVRRTGIDDGVIHAHDALAMASVIDPGVLSLQALHIEVETRGELKAGETLGYRRPVRRSAQRADAPADASPSPLEANAKVAVEVDVERFDRLLIERLVG